MNLITVGGLIIMLLVFTFLGFGIYREIKTPLEQSKLGGRKAKEARKELRRIKREYLITGVVCSVAFVLIAVVFRGSCGVRSHGMWGTQTGSTPKVP